MSRRRTRQANALKPAPIGLLALGLQRSRAIVVGLLPVLAMVAVTRVALAEAYHIPSGSMEPTLLVGDWLFVNKLRFGPHIPFTNVSLPGYATPARGDVVVFESPPQHPSIRISPDQVTPTLVKRIVGVGGDTLAMRRGRLMVNGVADSVVGTLGISPIAEQPQPIFEWQHRIATSSLGLGDAPKAPSLHEWGPLVVPAGTYFMMGDNRDNSVDSRFYGPVPRRNLRGTPTFVYYSFDATEGVEYVRAVTEIRWRRLGTWIR